MVKRVLHRAEGGTANRAAEGSYQIPPYVVVMSSCIDARMKSGRPSVSDTNFIDDPKGFYGGCVTKALVKTLEDPCKLENIKFVEVLRRMRSTFVSTNFPHIPKLCSSRFFDVNMDFDLGPACQPQRAKALLIGINYEETEAEVRGCHAAVDAVRRHLLLAGWLEPNLRILVDNGIYKPPTRENIEAGFEWLRRDCLAGDARFFHYCGKAAKFKDQGADDEALECALAPVDYQSNGWITDDEFTSTLVMGLVRDVFLFCLMDCCHQSDFLDLPYSYVMDDTNAETMDRGSFTVMKPNPHFSFAMLEKIALLACSVPKFRTVAERIRQLACCFKVR